MRKLPALWLLILAAGSCGVGPRVRDFIPATSPKGVYSIVRMHDQTHQGELLALDDSSLIVLTNDGVVQIPFIVITGAEFAQVKRISGASTADFRGRLGRRLRLVSRFPQGLNPELLSALLRAQQQNELIRARPRSVGSAQSILLQARAATSPYQNRSAAIAAGYRLVGPDTPDMGEHWVNPRILVDSKLDYDRPAVLTYVTLNGQARLAGIAYAIPLAPGETAPELPDNLEWHDHAGSVEEELVRGPHSVMSVAVPRLAMLHAWLWVDNPRGAFVEENWALPFLRLNLAVPAHFDVASARALSLLSGGDEYLIARVRSLAAGTGNAETVSARIVAARAQVEGLIGNAGGGTVDAATLTRLAGIWNDMAADVALMSASPRREQFQALLGTNGAHPQ